MPLTATRPRTTRLPGVPLEVMPRQASHWLAQPVWAERRLAWGRQRVGVARRYPRPRSGQRGP